MMSCATIHLGSLIHQGIVDGMAGWLGGLRDLAATLDVRFRRLGRHASRVGGTSGSFLNHAPTLDGTSRSFPNHAPTLDATPRSFPNHAPTMDIRMGSFPNHVATLDGTSRSFPDHAPTLDGTSGSLPNHASRVGGTSRSLLNPAPTMDARMGSGRSKVPTLGAWHGCFGLLAAIRHSSISLSRPTSAAMNWDESTWDSGSWDSPSTPAYDFLPTTKRKINHRTKSMNPTPEDDEVLEALTEELADGAHDHEVSVGIKQNTETVLRASLSDAIAAKQDRGAKDLLVNAKYALLHDADVAGELVLKNCRLRMVKLYGGQHNLNWELAGWTGNSTAVPDTQDKRFTLLNSQKNYFTTNPAAESVDMEATAAICAAAHTAISNARAAVNTAEFNQSNAVKAHKAGYKSLRKRVRGFITELGTLLADDDPRYMLFGLNVPANPTAPDGIATLTATAAGGGGIHVQWAYSTRMTGTRLMTKRTTGAEIDPDFISAGTAEGLEKTLSGFTPGVIVEVKGVAYNDGGDGPDSPVASVTVT